MFRTSGRILAFELSCTAMCLRKEKRDRGNEEVADPDSGLVARGEETLSNSQSNLQTLNNPPPSRPLSPPIRIQCTNPSKSVVAFVWQVTDSKHMFTIDIAYLSLPLDEFTTFELSISTT